MTSGKPITWKRAVLEDLYVQQRLTVRAIATRLGCCPASINRAVRQFGLTRNPKGTT